MFSFSTPNARSVRFLVVALGFVFIFGFICRASTLATSSQNTCIGLGGWPCGYTGPFSGYYYAGYATLGCIPKEANGTCAVPEIAVETSFLVISNASYVIDWANQSLKWGNHIPDGSTINLSGNLATIFYNKTAGSTYSIYYSNAKGLWNPQPSLQIQNATLTTQSAASACTTTLSFTVSGPPNAVWNPPMIPAGDCYAITEITQQQSHTTTNSNDINIVVGTMALVAIVVITAAAFAFLKRPDKG